MINVLNGGPSVTGTGSHCKICGHLSHCGTPLHKEILDGDSKPITIKVCYGCQCSSCTSKKIKKDLKNVIQTKQTKSKRT